VWVPQNEVCCIGENRRLEDFRSPDDRLIERSQGYQVDSNELEFGVEKGDREALPVESTKNVANTLAAALAPWTT
jgi:hypothetical protein